MGKLTPKEIFATRHRISFRIGFALLAAVTVTMVASFLGIFFFGQIQKTQNTVLEVAVPNMQQAFFLSKKGGDIVSGVPRLSAAPDRETFNDILEEVNAQVTDFQTDLILAPTLGLADEDLERINEGGQALLNNISTVGSLIESQFDMRKRRGELIDGFQEIEVIVQQLLASEIDQQTMYFSLGYFDRDQPPAPRDQHFSQAEFNRYRFLIELQRHATRSAEILSNAINVSDIPNLERLREQFETTIFRINRSLTYLENDDLYDVITAHIAHLVDYSLGVEGIFEIKNEMIETVLQTDLLFNENRKLGIELTEILGTVIEKAQEQTVIAADNSTQAVNTGRILLVILTVLTFCGALYFAFIYIGQRLLRRINVLSDRMRSLADGNLEAKVTVDGHDEIADMQQALEVFRRNALEVQRLNLVEELATELRSKNEELEHANDEIRLAQGQIVMREKLAALGELTAGVAHEIRNPMNFIRNFSESSEDLLEELLEEIMQPEKRDPPGSEIDDELLQEISEDLTSNLKRIRQHTTRANRIIDDMLKMGRDTQEFQETNLNELIEEHSKLAFHSARAQDLEFQLDIQYDFDESIGDIKVVPQDLGRLFINLTTNSGFACNEKRQALLAENPDSDYVPTLNIKTEHMGDQIIITFKDNGTGIPDELIEKIFNPFFTTKPTDQGTGLGLALCNDIIRTHGGQILVFTENGEYTEMVIDLPEDPFSFMEMNSNST